MMKRKKRERETRNNITRMPRAKTTGGQASTCKKKSMYGMGPWGVNIHQIDEGPTQRPGVVYVPASPDSPGAGVFGAGNETGHQGREQNRATKKETCFFPVIH